MNKIWNAFRYCELNFSLTGEHVPELQRARLNVADRRILSRLQGIIAATRRTLKEYRFDDAASELYQFFGMNFVAGISRSQKSVIAGAENGRMSTQVIFL